MIIRPKQSWFRLLFVWNGSVLQSIIPQLLVMGVVSVVAVVTHGRIFGEKIPLSATLLTLFGLTLAIFLGFRNTASYQRFDEARHLWGNLLIASRALASQALCYLPERAKATQLADSVVAMVYALKHELRRTDPHEDLCRLLGRGRADALRGTAYKPAALLHELRGELAALGDQGRLSDVRFWTLDAQLGELGKAVGGCERIDSTPIPFAYGVLLHRTVYTYCLLLPFGLVDSAELFTPLLCVFLSYTLIALEAIANEVAEPFGLAPNALALDAMTRNIERSVFELCGRELPQPLVPALPYQLT
jgi:putative membrane protein